MPESVPHGFLSGLPRRRFLTDISRSFTGLALGAMLAQEHVARAGEHTAWQPPDGQPHFTPKAKSVVWLFMNGGVSHAESFDPKPEITRYAGKSISETPYADTQNPDRLKRREVAFNVELKQKLYPLQVGFRVNIVLCPRCARPRCFPGSLLPACAKL